MSVRRRSLLAASLALGATLAAVAVAPARADE
jgi:hypothetical protein